MNGFGVGRWVEKGLKLGFGPFRIGYEHRQHLCRTSTIAEVLHLRCSIMEDEIRGYARACVTLPEDNPEDRKSPARKLSIPHYLAASGSSLPQFKGEAYRVWLRAAAFLKKSEYLI